MPVYGSDETVAVYDACSEFVDDCLVSDGSLIFNDDYWTEENLQELRTAFVDNPDESSDSFLEKFKRQLDEQDQDVIILASEALAVSLLFPSNIGKQRKLELVEEVLSWADRELPEGSMLDDAFNIGIGSGGQHYNTGRPFELGFLIKWAQQIKSVKPSARKAILSSPKKLKASL
jgi:5-methylcytosine-specific restriction protein B